MKNYNSETPIQVLFDDAYIRCDVFSEDVRNNICSHVDYLKDLFDQTFDPDSGYCSTNPEKSRKVIHENMLSIHDTINKYEIKVRSVSELVPLPDLSDLKNHIPENFCQEIYKDSFDGYKYPIIKTYDLKYNKDLLTELGETVEYLTDIYNSYPTIGRRLLLHIEELYQKEHKRLDGTDQHMYSEFDGYGYNHIALELDAIRLACQSLIELQRGR